MSSLPVSADIPPSTATVSVRALCPSRAIGLPSSIIFGPDIAGAVLADIPSFAFLIEHSHTHGRTERLIFDHGVRTDWEDKDPVSEYWGSTEKSTE